MTTTPPQTAPRCPRCGYDQSGAASSWTESCPLEGTCPECGLWFEWVEIYRPLLRAPRWSFEHAESGHARALFTTALRVQRPWRFWRSLRMEHPVVPPRLALLTLVGTLAAHAALGACVLILRCALDAVQAFTFSPTMRQRGLVFADSLKESAEAIWPAGDWVAWRGAWVMRDAVHVRLPDLREFVSPHAGLALAASMLLPLTFLLLHVSLKRAKVRADHVARAAAYGVVFLPGAFVAFQAPVLTRRVMEIANNAIGGASPLAHASDFMFRTHEWLSAGFLLGAYVLFWGLACRRYLRLERGWVVVPVLAAVSLLACFVVMVVVWGGPGLVRFWR